MLLEDRDGIRQMVGTPLVIRVQKRDPFTFREENPRIASRRSPRVILVYIPERITIALDDSGRAVRGTVINDDDLSRPECLGQRRVDTSPLIGFHVVCGDDD